MRREAIYHIFCDYANYSHETDPPSARAEVEIQAFPLTLAFLGSFLAPPMQIHVAKLLEQC